MTPLHAAPPVTVSVVSHGQASFVQQLLLDLNRFCRNSVARVVLTVNKVEPQIDVGRLPLPVTEIRNKLPRGFGANHNAAFLRCTTPWFLVVNPDIRLGSDVVAQLIQSASPRTGLLAPRIQEPAKASPEPYRDLPTPMELVRRRLSGHRPPAHPAWIAGMFMLLRSDAYAQVHGFDERFHMYCEDVDICARLRLSGWSLHLDENAVVVHDAQRASQSSLQPMVWHLASLAKLWTSPAFGAYHRLLRTEREA
jgi:N-acetylglucosaminyl-diphospho-decaprenol L-rhamnosyltransferase